MRENLILGSSHALSFAQAVDLYSATLDQASSDLVEVGSERSVKTYLIYATNRPAFVQLRATPEGGIGADFGPLMEKIRRFNAPGCKVVFNMGGNEHNLRFLTVQPTPFDFAHPACAEIQPGRQILPLAVMRAIIERLLRRTFLVTRLIAAELPDADRYYLPPPPPIPSPKHLHDNPEIFDFEANPLEHPCVRLKIHALYLEAAIAFCRANRLTYLPPPPENLDAQGFLAEPYWEGATHANADYYRPIVAQLNL